jgi:hypothetical protein
MPLSVVSPERADATKAQIVVATRIGIVLGGTVANRAWEAWRGKERTK